MPERLRIRPFREFLDREPHLSMIEMSGTIENGRFIISILGSRVELPTIEAGQDAWGDYAVVEENKQDLPDGFKLRLEVDGDESVLEVFLEGKGRSWGVDFGSSGHLVGRGSSYSAGGPKPLVN